MAKNAVPASAIVSFLCHRPIVCYSESMEATKTLKLRIRDKHAAVLSDNGARIQVWNYCNETSSRAIRERRSG